MKALRLIALLLPVTLAGCLFTTGQFNIDVDLDDAFVSGASVDREYVDLNDNTDYTDHKDDYAGLSDLAFIGNAQNSTGSDLAVEAWITADDTNFTTAAQVRENASRLWGPLSIAAGATRRVTWDDSAALFDPDGKNVLNNQLINDGTFTVYFLNATPILAKAGGDQALGSEVLLTNLSLILTIEGED